MSKTMSSACVLAAAIACATAQADPWAAPPSYYSGVSGTGAALKQSLASAMTSGHIQRAYGDFRFSAALHDADPNVSGNILLVYNLQSVSGTWDSGATWNREHVWPQSRQPGSASNSSRGNLGDPHALRPANPSVNSSRGNKPFGFATTTGSFGSLGSYYFPGDADKGDIARNLFYSATRWASLGLTLTNSFPSGNEMGGLDAFVAWHYADIPDEFERRRNHVIYSSAHNPTYHTNNRNAYIDLPGAVWSVFVDDFNDATLWVGASPDSDGSSLIEISARALADATPPTLPVALNRSGLDGVYYAITSIGDVVTDQPLTNNFTGAFAINDTTSRTIMAGIDPSAVSGPGLYSGLITIDNLDQTAGLGSGFGALDGDDEIVATLEAVAPSAASFSPSVAQSALTIDLGDVPVGATTDVLVPVHALEVAPGFTAGVSLGLGGAGDATGSTSVLTPGGVIEAGDSADVLVSLTPTTTGPATIVVTIDTADDPTITGAMTRAPLTLTLEATFGGACPADLDGSGDVDPADLAVLLGSWGQSGAGDLDGSGTVGSEDLAMMLGSWGACE